MRNGAADTTPPSSAYERAADLTPREELRARRLFTAARDFAAVIGEPPIRYTERYPL